MWTASGWERESIATGGRCCSAPSPPVFAELIQNLQFTKEDPVRKCFFSVTHDEQNHEIMCGWPSPSCWATRTHDLSAEDRTRQAPAETPSGCISTAAATGTGYKQAVPKL